MSEQFRLPERKPISLLSWLVPPIIHLILLVALLMRLTMEGLAYERIFKKFNMALPALTLSVLGVTKWLSEYWYVVVLSLPAIYLADAAVMLALGGWSRRAGWIWFLLVIVLLLGLWALSEISWYLPMRKLYEGLSR